MNKMLGEIFERPVDRTIEGVIKADDDASLKIEIDEYVLTNEIESKLEAFANAYATYETANGVWISGFFGSGKSHLLKMLVSCSTIVKLKAFALTTYLPLNALRTRYSPPI